MINSKEYECRLVELLAFLAQSVSQCHGMLVRLSSVPMPLLDYVCSLYFLSGSPPRRLPELDGVLAAHS